MANIIVPPDKIKIDPKRPESHPGFQKALADGKKQAKKLTFKDRGEEEWYNKAVRSNPNNVYGLPAFYPPLEITPSHGFGEGFSAETMPCGHAWKSKTENGVYGCKYGHSFIKAGKEDPKWSVLS